MRRELANIVDFIIIPEYYDYLKKVNIEDDIMHDIEFLALALRFKCSLWSNDKRLKKQTQVVVLTTNELIKIIGRKL
jgi:predicted nucleic acid-binding protein